MLSPDLLHLRDSSRNCEEIGFAFREITPGYGIGSWPEAPIASKNLHVRKAIVAVAEALLPRGRNCQLNWCEADPDVLQSEEPQVHHISPAICIPNEVLNFLRQSVFGWQCGDFFKVWEVEKQYS